MALFGVSPLDAFNRSIPLSPLDPLDLNAASSAPIGIFDSGVGGITVLQELQQHLPQESIVYFGDTARLPYGQRSPQEILQYVREILNWMSLQGVKMVIMACNTSSALALDIVRSEYTFPILGVILPGSLAAARQGQRIGVLATPATATSHAYQRAILEINPQAQVWEVGCPEFVPLIEADRLNDPQTFEIVNFYTKILLDQNIDTLIYGCTHYPHLHPILQQILPPTVQVINPATSVVVAAGQELESLGLRYLHSDRWGTTRFFVSGDPQQFAQLSVRWLGYQPAVEAVEITRYGVYPERISPAPSAIAVD